MRIRRRNVAWLTVIGVLVAVAILSGAATSVQAVALIGLFMAAMAASLLDINPTRLVKAQRSSLAQFRMSAQAREAVERATRRGSPQSEDITLIDVGLIAAQTTNEGMVMRRTRSVSKDDYGVRPFIKLHVQPSMADVNSVIRFEIIDQNGQTQYVHEMKTYLRDGEMDILADHQLPLATNDRLTNVGDGDLRVYIDGRLAGVLTFTLAPSMRERGRQINQAQQAEERLRVQDELPPEEETLSFEDLLRQRKRENRDR
jgi:hypothetical protein